MNPAQRALLEKRGGHDVGRDPRRVNREELLAAGHRPMSPLKALRARCLDCCAGSAQEVRPVHGRRVPSLAPFRTGAHVWLSEAQKEGTTAGAEEGL